jgi:hypothetical protein
VRKVLAVVAAVGCLSAVPAAALAGPLRLGFTDRDAFQGSAAERAVALQHVKAARGSLVRISSGWREIATSRPPTSAAARDPNWPGYNWGPLDAQVKDVATARLVPIISFTGAPDFAEGANRPHVSAAAPVGTWRPSPSAYRDFAEAVARRYSRGFAGLPAVRYLEAWNEPNLARYLSPQWVRRKGKLVPASPSSYRALLNGFYNGVKTGNPHARVITAGTAPFGDPQRGGLRMPPAFFVRDWLCVSGRVHPRARHCSGGPARFDVFAHHPYSVRGPERKALNTDDVVSRDLRKLTRPLAAAIRGGNVFPRHKKQLWVTELSWDSRPPDPDGVPAGTQARWMEGAFYYLWRGGADAVTWFNIRDQARGQGYPFTFQSGVYLRGTSIAKDRPKPAFRAFRFPFTAYGGRAWGIAPKRGRVLIQIRRRGQWRRLRSLKAGRGRIFSKRLSGVGGALLRAHQGRENSLSWRVR